MNIIRIWKRLDSVKPLKVVKRSHNMQVSKSMHLKEEIKDAIVNDQPVIALESTIITHGLPYPHNIRFDIHLLPSHFGFICVLIPLLLLQLNFFFNIIWLPQGHFCITDEETAAHTQVNLTTWSNATQLWHRSLIGILGTKVQSNVWVDLLWHCAALPNNLQNTYVYTLKIVNLLEK